MTNPPRRWLSVVCMGAGLAAITALWLQADSVDMAFSGPVRVTAHLGLLSCVETTTRYKPTLLGTSLDGRAIQPPALKPDEVIWDHHGELGNAIVVLRVLEKTRTVNYPALAGSVLATLLVLWFAVVRPGKKLVHSWRASRERPLPNPCEFSSTA